MPEEVDWEIARSLCCYLYGVKTETELGDALGIAFRAGQEKYGARTLNEAYSLGVGEGLLRMLQTGCVDTEKLVEKVMGEGANVHPTSRRVTIEMTPEEAEFASLYPTPDETSCDCVECVLLRKLNAAWESADA